jgi:hypothetical protein
LIFGLAFWTLGVNWLALAFVREGEMRLWVFLIRLGAFVLILWGIADKNRRGR